MSIVVCIFVLSILTTAEATEFVVVGTSMLPIICPGDVIQAISTDTIRSADIIVFQFPWRIKSGNPPLIKQVIGIPGDSLGTKFNRPIPNWIGHKVVPNGFVYVHSLNGSYDSRRYGLVRDKYIIGKVVEIKHKEF